MFILKVGHSHIYYTLSHSTFISWIWFGDLESPDNSAKGIRSLGISRPAGLDYFWLFSTLRLCNMKSWAILLLTLHKSLWTNQKTMATNGHQWVFYSSTLQAVHSSQCSLMGRQTQSQNSLMESNSILQQNPAISVRFSCCWSHYFRRWSPRSGPAPWPFFWHDLPNVVLSPSYP